MVKPEVNTPPTSQQGEALQVFVQGQVETDGSTVYIGGMDLANVLRASMPSRPNSNRHQGWDVYPDVTISIDVVYRKLA